MTDSQIFLPEPTERAIETPPPRRRGVWTAMALVAILAGGAGTAFGMWLQGSANATGASPASEHAGMPGMDGPPRPTGASDKAVYISPARQQMVGVRTGLVERQHVRETVRTVGMLGYDETRTVQIHTRVSGWVEQLFVDYVGKPVRRGQPLFAIYSPDVAAAQSEYLIALRAREQFANSPIAEARVGADGLLAASRERLKRWEVSDGQITNLERKGRASRTVTLSSPFDGVVIEKNAFAGQYVTPDMTSFKLADLSTIWVIGQVFEYEAAHLRPGDAIDVEFPYEQGPDPMQAQVDFIYPEVDPMTRRVRFRATLKNADRKLKPDTYVTLVWHGEATDRLVVPKEAVIDTGARKYVLLALADGYFEPRDVKVGPPVGDFYPVLNGVLEGDRVVTSAQFLIDSETNLMEAMQNMAMSMPGMEMGPTKAAPSSGSTSMESMPGTTKSLTDPPLVPDLAGSPSAQPKATAVPPKAVKRPSSGAPSSGSVPPAHQH